MRLERHCNPSGLAFAGSGHHPAQLGSARAFALPYRPHQKSAGTVDMRLQTIAGRADFPLPAEAEDLPLLVLRRFFLQICAGHNVPADPETSERFARTPHDWPAYPDTHDGLARPQEQALIGALSNIDNASLAASCRHMHIHFDITVTAERVGAYKPDTSHFEAALADINARGIPRERILHVGQSLRAKITLANRLGLTFVWIHRPERHLGVAGFGTEEAVPDLTVSTLAELISILTDGSGN